MSTELILPEMGLRTTTPLPSGVTEVEQTETNEILHHHLQATRLDVGGAYHRVAAGYKLRAFKKQNPKNFAKWCRDNLPEIHVRTIQRYMRLANAWPKLRAKLKLDQSVNAARLSEMTDEEFLAGLSQQAILQYSNSSAPKIPKVVKTPRAHDVEWLTPVEVASRVAKLLGMVDLDPCAAETAKPTIQAARQITAPEDGLSGASWQGKVWVNPGNADNLSAWIGRAMDSFHEGAVSECLLLLPVKTDDDAFAPLQPFPRAFFRERLKVLSSKNPDRPAAPLPYAAMVVHLARPDRLADFAEIFGTLADIYFPFRFGA